MDEILELKQKYDADEIQNKQQSIEFLKNSELTKKLLTDFNFDVLNLLNRLTELSEIPLTSEIEKVNLWVNKLADLSFCDDGFSFSGKSDDILSCYNSMITTVLIKMKYGKIERISKGIEWILKYQNFERGLQNKWKGSRIQKYGGCMKQTPCYIGIVKALITLTEYKKSKYYETNEEVEKRLSKGLEYILDHNVFQRKTNGKPITKDINKLTYPFSYKTNLIEILRLLKDNNLLLDPRCEFAIEFLNKKKQKNGFWKINSSYLPKSWIEFDKPKENGLWVSYEINRLIN